MFVSGEAGRDEVEEVCVCCWYVYIYIFREEQCEGASPAPPSTHANPQSRSTDYRKLQSRLLTKWKTIPIEVAPVAAHRVIDRLRQLGCINATVREGAIAKAGPIKTDQDFFIVDAEFKPLLVADDLAKGMSGKGEDGVWEVETLARAIKDVHGVLDVGIFTGPTGPEASGAGVVGGQRPVAAYFGMEDGSVTVREARSKRHSLVATYPPILPVSMKHEGHVNSAVVD